MLLWGCTRVICRGRNGRMHEQIISYHTCKVKLCGRNLSSATQSVLLTGNTAEMHKNTQCLKRQTAYFPEPAQPQTHMTHGRTLGKDTKLAALVL